MDYQIGNVSSVINAVKKLGYKVKLSNKKDDFNKASHLILPGVGSFEVGMANIIKLGIKYCANLVTDITFYIFIEIININE